MMIGSGPRVVTGAHFAEAETVVPDLSGLKKKDRVGNRSKKVL